MTLLVVGALHWDVVVRAPRLPVLDETLRGSAVDYRFGGKGGNQALAAAAAGAAVAFAGRVGADAAGDQMRGRLAAAGVDTGQLQTGPGASGMSAAMVTADGSYGAVIVSAENHSFDVSALAVPDGCRMILTQNEMAGDVLPALTALAAGRGVPLVWNAAPASGVTPAALAGVDTLIVNRVEAAALIGAEPDALDPAGAAAALRAAAPKAEILITLGAGGVVFAAPGAPPAHAPAEPASVVSTHGAGDVFTGVYAARRLAGAAMAEAVGAAQAAAARHIGGKRETRPD